MTRARASIGTSIVATIATSIATIIAIARPAIADDDGPPRQVVVGPGVYRPMYPASPREARVSVPAFRLDVLPVTNAEFLAFVRATPKWQRGRASRLVVDDRYLSHWAGPLELGPQARPAQPVTRVSWFAAKAYCAAAGRRLPTEREWELAATASWTRADGDRDPAWRAQVLAWYQTPSQELAVVGAGRANVWGVHDLHGLVWEWVYDYSAALVAIDAREKSDGDKGRFCGAGAALAADTTDFATFMRIAFRSSLEGNYSANNLGFRCAADLERAR